jgi:hypothetical protein
MKLSNLFMIAMLVGTLGVFGCSDDPPATGNGGSGGEGTAGTGGDGAAGGGGEGGTAADPCNEGLCRTDDAKKTECETKVQECLDNNPPANQEECIIGVVTVVCASV